MKKTICGVALALMSVSLINSTTAQPLGYLPLKLDGRYVSWPIDGSGKVRLTWAIADQANEFARTVNCTHMAPLKNLEANIPPDMIKHEIEAAFQYWQASAPIEFSFSSDWRKADIVIGAMMNPAGIAFADVVYEPQREPDKGRIVKSLICLNPEAKWKTNFDGNLKTHDIRYVVAHEIGHAIGLDHPSASGQLMSFKYEERFREPQSGDKAGAVALYGTARAVLAGAR